MGILLSPFNALLAALICLPYFMITALAYLWLRDLVLPPDIDRQLMELAELLPGRRTGGVDEGSGATGTSIITFVVFIILLPTLAFRLQRTAAFLAGLPVKRHFGYLLVFSGSWLSKAAVPAAVFFGIGVVSLMSSSSADAFAYVPGMTFEQFVTQAQPALIVLNGLLILCMSLWGASMVAAAGYPGQPYSLFGVGLLPVMIMAPLMLFASCWAAFHGLQTLYTLVVIEGAQISMLQIIVLQGVLMFMLLNAVAAAAASGGISRRITAAQLERRI